MKIFSRLSLKRGDELVPPVWKPLPQTISTYQNIIETCWWYLLIWVSKQPCRHPEDPSNRIATLLENAAYHRNQWHYNALTTTHNILGLWQWLLCRNALVTFSFRSNFVYYLWQDMLSSEFNMFFVCGLSWGVVHCPAEIRTRHLLSNYNTCCLVPP